MYSITHNQRFWKLFLQEIMWACDYIITKYYIVTTISMIIIFAVTRLYNAFLFKFIYLLMFYNISVINSYSMAGS